MNDRGGKPPVQRAAPHVTFDATKMAISSTWVWQVLFRRPSAHINLRLQHPLLIRPTLAADANAVGIGISDGQFGICASVDNRDATTSTEGALGAQVQGQSGDLVVLTEPEGNKFFVDP